MPASGSVGGFCAKYLTDDTKEVLAITVNANADANPTEIVFTLTVAGGVINKAYNATSAFGHNFNPLVISSNNNVLTHTFASNSHYAEYVAQGAVWFLTVRWD